MMTALITIEDALLARAQARLGALVRQYAPLPGGIGQLADILAAHGALPPALFATWRGSAVPPTSAGLLVLSRWSVLVVTQHPAGDLARRRGSAEAIGGYTLAEQVALALHDHTLPGIGTLSVTRLGPLEGAPLAALAVTIAEVEVTLRHGLADDSDPLALDDFLHFHGDIDLAPADGVVDAVTDVFLPGGSQ